MKLKVCGLKDPENIESVVALRPDYIGFIFYRQSPRCAAGLDAPFVKAIKGVERVGVFVNERAERMLAVVKEYALDLVQLHGDETPGLCAALNKVVPVIKAFRVDEKFDFTVTADYEKACRYFLFDTKADTFGGSGQMFDHKLLERYQGSLPYFLSGGLSAENIHTVNPGKTYSIDVNSKFETAPGIKDIEKLKLLKTKLTHELRS
jgi:phosphoribosylanthranilate isomerase